MKSTLLLTFLISSFSHAGTVHLNIGDTITLQPNTRTTVTCGEGNGACSLAVRNLQARFDYCKMDISKNVEECLNEIWPSFKRSNAQCIDDGFSTCLAFCKSSFETLDCLKICE